ncbi:hypothetical protein P171DRAFT_262949 [Karstenula rhodostoma CBS 690.94]|uniref:Uncharacterized protein n=1 Tax=Karstenula rhodostoma CBS 690.94 TaxID=1392251 RepID=A0A9P4UEN2_9PLEO|nr:hypothetical protein P171DRAFT_262949 [Karstenula rhodostoma CBS 690.94]
MFAWECPDFTPSPRQCNRLANLRDNPVQQSRWSPTMGFDCVSTFPRWDDFLGALHDTFHQLELKNNCLLWIDAGHYSWRTIFLTLSEMPDLGSCITFGSTPARAKSMLRWIWCSRPVLGECPFWLKGVPRASVFFIKARAAQYISSASQTCRITLSDMPATRSWSPTLRSCAHKRRGAGTSSKFGADRDPSIASYNALPTLAAAPCKAPDNFHRATALKSLTMADFSKGPTYWPSGDRSCLHGMGYPRP